MTKSLSLCHVTTPGTALIALSRDYQLDQQQKSLTAVQQRAFHLAVDSNTPLAVWVTALSIAGADSKASVQALASRLTQDPTTPLILKKSPSGCPNKWTWL